jgi:VCBS repeat-containing protein
LNGLLLGLVLSVLLPVNNVLAAPPVAGDDNYTTPEDTVLNVTAPGLLQNDNDPDGDPVVFFISSAPTSGSVTIDPTNSGAFTYTPNLNFNGVVTFTYRLYDGTAFSNLATVTITVTPVNDSPVATNDAYMALTGQALNVPAPGVLANDSDVDSPTLTAVLVTNPTNGTLTLNANGSFSYTSNPAFSGTDSFTYQASDGSLPSNTAIVTINVVNNNRPPVVVNDAYVISQNTTLNQPAPGVLQNDTDPDGNPITAKLVTNPANGTLTLNPDGSFSYQPNPAFSGVDTFTYQASDGLANSVNTATVSITVVPPTLAIISVGNASVREGNSGTVNAVFNVTLNRAISQTVTVNYATADGTAKAPGDYIATSGTLTFLAGETAKTIVVPVKGDLIVETNETFQLNLSNPVNGVLVTTTATGTIIDDDGVKEVRPADLVLQLGVTPDREFGIAGGSSNFVSYQLLVKNIGPGKAGRIFVKMPVDANLEIAFATFSNPQAWVEKIGQEGSAQYVQLRLPDLETAQFVKITLVFRAKAAAAPGTVTTRIKVFWDDEVASGRSTASNAVRFALVAGSGNRNETDGKVQFLQVVTGETTAKKLVLTGDFFAPDEKVDFWYTDKNGASKKLEGALARADKEGYIKLEVNLEKVSFESNQSYVIAGYGARSSVYGSLVIQVSSTGLGQPQVRQPTLFEYRLFTGKTS